MKKKVLFAAAFMLAIVSAFAQGNGIALGVISASVLVRATFHLNAKYSEWGLDFNLLQDKIRRKSAKAARNLDTIQRTVYSIFSIWKGLRKKLTDKQKGLAQMMRSISMSFTKLIRFLEQKLKK